MSDTLQTCPRCFGRGYRPEGRRPSRRNPHALGFYARTCPRCGGAGQVPAATARRRRRACVSQAAIAAPQAPPLPAELTDGMIEMSITGWHRRDCPTLDEMSNLCSDDCARARARIAAAQTARRAE